MIRKLLSTLVLGTSLFTSAQAEIAGLFGGAHVYASLWRDNHQFTLANGATGTFNLTKYTLKNYGVEVGYLMEIGDTKNIVGVMIYGDQFKTLPVMRPLSIMNGPTVGQVAISRMKEQGVGLIVGKLINPKVLVYAALYRANATFRLAYTALTFPPAASQTYTPKYKVNVPGIGGVYQVAKNLAVGAEYMYYGLFNKMTLRSDSFATFVYKPFEHRIRLFVRVKV